MGFPLKSGSQFISVDSKKKILGQYNNNLAAITQTYIKNLLEFELSKENWSLSRVRNKEAPQPEIEKGISWLLNSKKNVGQPTKVDLLDLHCQLGERQSNSCRQNQVPALTPNHLPTEPPLILPAVDRFFEWVSSPSFGEMHPIEQMTISQMRLTEIFPFEQHSQITSSLFSYRFLVDNGLLLPFYETHQLSVFSEALDKAFLFSTQALVQLNTQACEKAQDCVLKVLAEN